MMETVDTGMWCGQTDEGIRYILTLKVTGTETIQWEETATVNKQTVLGQLDRHQKTVTR